MKLQQYIMKLQEILIKHGDLPLVYSSDDEGNYYEELHFSPDVIEFNFDERERVSREPDEEPKINAVCIN